MIKAGISLALALFVSLPAAAQSTVKLTTLDWCPYTCAVAPDGGVNTVIVREAFKAVGYQVEIQFLPWQRVMATAKGSSDVAGYFPEYPGERDGFALSPAIGTGPLGLILRKGSTPPAPTAEAIKGLKLGVVSGYINAAPVTAAIAAGLKPEEAVSDVLNIRKLAAGRIDAAEIDRFVFDYLLRTDPALADVKNSVSFALPLEDLSLHVAFNTTDHGRKIAVLFAEGLAKIDAKRMQRDYFAMTQ